MPKVRIAQIQLLVAMAIIVILSTTLIAILVVRYVNPATAAATPEKSTISKSVTISLAQALSDGQPFLVVFTPVEQCRIQYCVTADLVAQRLSNYAINVVEAPVHAVPMHEDDDRSLYPLIDWGVYLVEPFVYWLPEFAEGEFGYGLNAPAATLVDAEGQVVFRSQHLMNIDDFAKDVIAHSTIQRNRPSGL